ncbi:MAG: hypothetical protein ACI9EF_001872 [Pseudohongiellaceae bacterium]|jgi:hypothetical protein
MLPLLALSLALCSLDALPAQQPGGQPSLIRFIELTGDELLDKLHLGPDSTLSVSVNLGGGVFAPIVQELPSVIVTDVLAGDLGADGLIDPTSSPRTTTWRCWAMARDAFPRLPSG